jgi:hypothetical protein
MATLPGHVFHSLHAPAATWIPADEQNPFWAEAPAVQLHSDSFGERVQGIPTTVRSRWTSAHLYVLFQCSYQELYLKPDPQRQVSTWELWNWDVVELFLGDDWQRLECYREFELSPQGEWLDLEIDRNPPELDRNRQWTSGLEVVASIEPARCVWLGAMRIPFSAVTSSEIVAGKTFRANLYRLEGAPQRLKSLAWMPTGSDSFHVPASFGTLELIV